MNFISTKLSHLSLWMWWNYTVYRDPHHRTLQNYGSIWYTHTNISVPEAIQITAIRKSIAEDLKHGRSISSISPTRIKAAWI